LQTRGSLATQLKATDLERAVSLKLHPLDIINAIVSILVGSTKPLKIGSDSPLSVRHLYFFIDLPPKKVVQSKTNTYKPIVQSIRVLVRRAFPCQLDLLFTHHYDDESFE
jgi:hypothetical protein